MINFDRPSDRCGRQIRLEAGTSHSADRRFDQVSQAAEAIDKYLQQFSNAALPSLGKGASSHQRESLEPRDQQLSLEDQFLRKAVVDL